MRRVKVRLSRDSVIFGVGILGIIYETVLTQADRPTLLVLFGACIGLPAFLRTDEKQAEKIQEAVVRQESVQAQPPTTPASELPIPQQPTSRGTD